MEIISCRSGWEVFYSSTVLQLYVIAPPPLGMVGTYRHGWARVQFHSFFLHVPAHCMEGIPFIPIGCPTCEKCKKSQAWFTPTGATERAHISACFQHVPTCSVVGQPILFNDLPYVREMWKRGPWHFPKMCHTEPHGLQMHVGAINK